MRVLGFKCQVLSAALVVASGVSAFNIKDGRLVTVLNANGQSITNVASILDSGGNPIGAVDTNQFVLSATSGYSFFDLPGPYWHLNSPTAHFGVVDVGGPIFSAGLSGVEAYRGLAASSIDLDRNIESWEDIGITYTNAVVRNAAVTITNNAAWSGWTTTGTLAAGTIKLMVGQYLLSPVQSNGIAAVAFESWSHLGGTTPNTGIHTNGALATGAAPWRGAIGQWRIEAVSLLPGSTEGLYVSNATITAYANLADAQDAKQVANVGIIDDPAGESDAVNKRYADATAAAARTYADTLLAAYSADADKTVRGSQLRLGNMWVVSPADTSGTRFIMSGGEISGDGQLLGTTNEFVISKNDYPLLSFTSSASGLYVATKSISLSGGTNVNVTLGIATNGVVAAPYAEWSTDLKVGEWTRIQAYTTETYPTQSSGRYTLAFTLPLAPTMYFRAMQPTGLSRATLNTDILDLGSAYLIIRDSGGNRWKVTVSSGGVLQTTDLDP